MQDSPLLIADVARRLGVSRTRTVHLDGVLEPVRTPNGTRIYSASKVDFVAGQRAVQKAASR